MESLFEVAERPTGSIDERFAAFVEANPDIYAEFVRLALEMRKRRPRYSADAIIHRIRWERDLNGVQSDGFKISDHYVSRFSRLAMKQYPELEGFFELRRTKAER